MHLYIQIQIQKYSQIYKCIANNTDCPLILGYQKAVMGNEYFYKHGDLSMTPIFYKRS